MADLLSFAPVRVFDDNADNGAGYLVRFYRSGTTTPVTVYQDEAGDIPHAQPLAADAAGVFPAVFFSGGAVKAVITDAEGATVHTVDPVVKVAAAASGAASVTFEATVDLPYTNVQAAIEGAAQTAASGFTPYGLGVTGNAGLLAGIDATDIASGAYRYDNDTSGTFPTGVDAADTGIVETWREASGSAIMFLYPDDSPDRVFFRRMASSTWGTWREAITAAQGAAEGDLLYRGSSTWSRLAKGSAGQVLAMNSGATAPEWGDDLQIGVGQTWQDVSASRTPGDTYQNTTGRPISVLISNVGTGGSTHKISSDGSTWLTIARATGGGADHNASFIVPDGWYYQSSNLITGVVWMELR